MLFLSPLEGFLSAGNTKMPRYIKDIEQQSDEWFDLRIGSVGGSSINSVLARGEGKSRKTLLYKLAGEILAGRKLSGYRSAAMQRGNELEADARRCYEFLTGNTVEQIALIQADTPLVHYSPDGLIGEDGGLELKLMEPHIYIELIDTKKISLAYMRQVNHFFWVSGRDYMDFAAYCPEIESRPMWIQRQTPDAKIQEQINTELPVFLAELEAMVKKVSA